MASYQQMLLQREPLACMIIDSPKVKAGNHPPMNHTIPDHPFWYFSLNAYGEPQARQILFRWHQEKHLNSSLVLFCCWYSLNNMGSLTPTEIKQLIDATEPWHRLIVEPLQKLRDQITQNSKLQNCIGIARGAAQDAMQIETLIMAEIFLKKPLRGKRSPTQKALQMIRSIMIYCKMMQIEFDTNLNEDINTLANVFVTELNSVEIRNISQTVKIELQKLKIKPWYQQLTLAI